MEEKIYKPLEERIEILRERKMQIRGNAKKEIRILQENNYYNLINGYKHLFLDKFEMSKSSNLNKGDIFLEGTKPSELHAVMKFDNALRTIFLKELLTIEDKVKHAIVQSFYEAFDNPNLHKEYEYIKEKYYDTGKVYTVRKTNKKLWVNETRYENRRSAPIRNSTIHESDYKLLDREKIYDIFFETVTDTIAKQKDNNQSIKAYYYKHGYIPLWILTNILTLGNTSKLFIILKKQVVEQVMNKLGIKHNNDIDIYNMYNVLGILTLYRNICAHNERFICTPHSYVIDDEFMGLGKALPYYKDSSDPRHKLKSYQRDKRKDVIKKLFPLIFSIVIFYENDRRNKFVKKIEKEIEKLEKKLNTIGVDKVKKDIGLNFNLQQAIDKIEPNSIQK